MATLRIGGAIVTYSPDYRMRLADGRYVFMTWHSYCGPSFFHDRDCNREIDKWWEDEILCECITWFVERGHKA